MALALLWPAHASALLTQKSESEGDVVPLIYFYPYPTSYSYVDERYAFVDDPLTAFAHIPYSLPIVIKRAPVRGTMTAPRMTFVKEMYRSTEAI